MTTKKTNPWKKDFPILKQKIHGKPLVYLDNAATTQKPKSVIDAIKKFYEEKNANVHRGIHKLSEDATATFESARNTIAKFINAHEHEVVFTKGTTDSINMIVLMLEPHLSKGDEVILTEMEHHSNLVPWQRLQQKGVVLKFIPITEDYELDIASYEKLLTKKTKVVSLTFISNVLGIQNNIKKIAAAAHHVGAICVIDAAQAAAHTKIDVKHLDVDFLCFSGHKVYGPTGIGVLWGKESLLTKYDPPHRGGGMIREVTLTSSTWADMPAKFEPGTQNISGAVALATAINYITSIGIKNIEEHEHALTDYCISKLQKIPEITILGNKRSKGIISFVIDGIHPHDIAHFLDQHGIAVRAGHHCCQPLMKKLGITGTTRASFALYNTEADVDALIKALKELIEVFK